MAKNPLVSVVVTTYNRPDRLQRALKSVVNQIYKNLEIIVVDGSNSKENEKVTKIFNDKRIKYVKVESWAVSLPSWSGVQHARNIGCKLAKGKYIAMLDDDDVWWYDKIDKQIEVAERFGEKLGLVICDNIIECSGKVYVDKPKTYPTYKDLLKSFNLSSTSTFLIRREVLKEVGYWNELLRGMHEYDIALKIAKTGYLIYTVHEPLMKRERISNTSRNYYYIKIAEIMDFWKYYSKDFIPEIGLSGFMFNVVKTLGLFFVYMLGFVIKEKVWNIIYPFKVWYEQGVSL